MSGGGEAAARLAREAARDCVRCGACMSVCPVYKAGRREELAARGKLVLLEGLDQGRLSPSRELARSLGRCLLCGRCQANCPNQVASARGIQAGRAYLAQRAGTPFIKRMLLGKLLPHPPRLDLAARAGRLAQAAVPADSGLLLRMPFGEQVAGMPRLADRPFLAQAPTEIPGPAGVPRLGFFVGCVTNYLRPELARRAVKLLARRYTVIIPPGQGCCGLPAGAAGLDQAAADLARRNLDLMAGARVDRIVTVCGSCLHGLTHEASRLLGDSYADLAGRVVEISQVLADEPGLAGGTRPLAQAAAVHDPCHLCVGADVTAEPRRMLESAGVDLAAMEGADQCCGGGGLFAVNEPELSRAVFAPRREAFLQSGAPVLATSCSGCWLQWRQGLGEGARVVHPIELLGLPE